VVGNGSAAATFQLLGGTHLFQNNLIVTNNGTLAGVGNIVVNGGAGQTIIASGGVLSPGNSPGVLTNSGTLVFNGGGTYLWQVNNFTGGAGATSGWDLLQVLGALTNAATAGTPFNINIASLTAGNAAGWSPT